MSERVWYQALSARGTERVYGGRLGLWERRATALPGAQLPPTFIHGFFGPQSDQARQSTPTTAGEEGGGTAAAGDDSSARASTKTTAKARMLFANSVRRQAHSMSSQIA